MGRPRSFDADAVLDRAVEVFRAKGFDGASVEDLEKATRLGRQSLYGAFGDKHSLYLSALDRYDRTRVESLVGKLSEGKDAADSIERFLRFVVDEDPKLPTGLEVGNQLLLAPAAAALRVLGLPYLHETTNSPAADVEAIAGLASWGSNASNSQRVPGPPFFGTIAGRIFPGRFAARQFHRAR